LKQVDKIEKDGFGAGSRRQHRRHGHNAEDAEECSESLLRFAAINDLNAVKPIHQGHDPFFPAAATSIAPAGANCGDSAHNIRDSCSKYNSWEPMDRISQARGFSFNIFDPATGVPHHTDVRQGGLGTCYFLSAIASIAYRAPKVIADMFVRREHWRNGVLSTQWLINGLVSVIEVDKTVPSKRGRPFFTTLCKKTGTWWPAVLEKAWAKIYGSYKAAEAGFWAIAASAITRAPTVTYYHSEWKGEPLWQVLVRASQNKWPMGASTTESHYGLAAGHAYSVLEAWHDKRKGRLVRVRNPWHANYYKGRVPNPNYGDESGIFTMTFAEFERAFYSNSIAKVVPSYDVTSMKVEEVNGAIKGAYTFNIRTSRWFSVSVVWPNHRMLCKRGKPTYVLAVQKHGSNQIFTPEPAAYASNAVHVEIPGGAVGGSGTYTVLVSADFPINTFIHEVQLNVYSENPVQIRARQVDYSSLILAMVGPVKGGKPCDTVMVENQGMWTVNSAKPLHGVPTYNSWDGKHLAYYVSEEDLWYLTNSRTWDQVSKGQNWAYAKIPKEDFMCGCRDDPNGVGGSGSVGCARVKAPNVKYGNVRCDKASQFTTWAQAFCPVTCGVKVCRGQ
jgi:hypothetical protein